MRIYLAGPMRGREHFNFPAFDKAAARLRQAGHTVTSPAELDRAVGFDGSGDLPHGFTDGALARDLPEICRCDAVAVLPGWRSSKGARLEVALARALDPPRPILDAETLKEITEAVDRVDSPEPAPAVERHSSGAIRDRRDGKGRYDLLPVLFIRHLARHLEAGGKHYGARNWERGMPVSRFIDSALRHTFQFLEGRREEDHLTAAAWNLAAARQTIEMVFRGRLPIELIDLPDYTPRAEEAAEDEEGKQPTVSGAAI